MFYVRLFVSTMLAAGSGFVPMTPIGAECIPVMLTVEGEDELAESAYGQLKNDIDFSGLLVTADDGYVEVDVSVDRDVDGYRLTARVLSGGEPLMGRDYTGSNFYSICHAFADDLVYDLTGEPGIASSLLAYVNRSDDGYSLMVKSQDPRPPRTIMFDRDVITTPAWSPDGDRIVFTSYRSGNADLWCYDFSSASAVKVLDVPGLNSSPAWSPDGSMVVLTLSKNGNSDIYMLDMRTSAVTRLTTRESIETSPCFSPTGRQLVFTSDRLGHPQLYVMDSSGGTAMRVTRSHRYCDSPAWSPDGDRIAYTARVGGDFHIFVMNADGSDVRQLTFEGTLNEDPVWGPTGRHIAFSSDMGGGRDIYVVELNGLTIRRLTAGGDNYCPTWAPLGFR